MFVYILIGAHVVPLSKGGLSCVVNDSDDCLIDGQLLVLLILLR